MTASIGRNSSHCITPERKSQKLNSIETIFHIYHSHRYNNEWMVVDYKKFYPGEKLEDNTLIVLEQIPGQVVWNDKTEFLRTQTYWPSYNLA